MPKVPLIATGDFKYMTRRLTAGDAFEAKNDIEARILTRVRKVAEAPKAKAARVAPKVEEVLTAEVVETPAEPVKVAPTRKAPAKRKAKAKK